MKYATFFSPFLFHMIWWLRPGFALCFSYKFGGFAFILLVLVRWLRPSLSLGSQILCPVLRTMNHIALLTDFFYLSLRLTFPSLCFCGFALNTFGFGTVASPFVFQPA